jgi:hypothetical protein
MSNMLSKVCLFVILAVVAFPVAFAAAPVASANVPFAFTVNGVNLEAGTYYFETSGGAGVLSLRDAAGHRVMCITIAGVSGAAGESQAVFVKSGNTYKLAEIRLANAQQTLLIPAALRDATAEKIEIAMLRP